VIVLAQEEARTLGHDYIGTEHILLGLVAEDEGLVARILLDFDAEPKKIRNEVIQAAGASPIADAASHGGGGGSVPRPSPFGREPLAAPSDLELGWRARPIALAALGASVLARMTFVRSKTGNLEPLEMQVLARLTRAARRAARRNRRALRISGSRARLRPRRPPRCRPHPHGAPARQLSRRPGWRPANLDNDGRLQRGPALAGSDRSSVRSMASRPPGRRRRDWMTARRSQQQLPPGPVRQFSDTDMPAIACHAVDGAAGHRGSRPTLSRSTSPAAGDAPPGRV
jgi:hypothetical protein